MSAKSAAASAMTAASASVVAEAADLAAVASAAVAAVVPAAAVAVPVKIVSNLLWRPSDGYGTNRPPPLFPAPEKLPLHR
jgi:hypothetical protein